MDIYHIAVKQTLMNYSYCIMQMSDGHFFYNDVECDTQCQSARGQSGPKSIHMV